MTSTPLIGLHRGNYPKESRVLRSTKGLKQRTVVSEPLIEIFAGRKHDTLAQIARTQGLLCQLLQLSVLLSTRFDILLFEGTGSSAGIRHKQMKNDVSHNAFRGRGLRHTLAMIYTDE